VSPEATDEVKNGGLLLNKLLDKDMHGQG